MRFSSVYHRMGTRTRIVVEESGTAEALGTGHGSTHMHYLINDYSKKSFSLLRRFQTLPIFVDEILRFQLRNLTQPARPVAKCIDELSVR